jgi:hypothetical protein
VASAAAVLVGLWRVGVEPPSALGLRLGDLPGLVENLRFDVARLTGRLDTRAYLARFKGARKYDALANHDLVELIERTTDPGEPILVFGFAPGVYVEAGRASASRFFWSRPVLVEFEAGRPGYGSAGLLADVRRNPPAVVALQKQDWGVTLESHGYFHGTPALREWLTSRYTLVMDTPVFEVWRARP